jgi:hypothetical protein
MVSKEILEERERIKSIIEWCLNNAKAKSRLRIGRVSLETLFERMNFNIDNPDYKRKDYTK